MRTAGLWDEGAGGGGGGRFFFSFSSNVSKQIADVCLHWKLLGKVARFETFLKELNPVERKPGAWHLGADAVSLMDPKS